MAIRDCTMRIVHNLFTVLMVRPCDSFIFFYTFKHMPAQRTIAKEQKSAWASVKLNDEERSRMIAVNCKQNCHIAHIAHRSLKVYCPF